MRPNYRPRVDAGWPVLFTFQRAWPRATQAGRYAPQCAIGFNSAASVASVNHMRSFFCRFRQSPIPRRFTVMLAAMAWSSE